MSDTPVLPLSSFLFSFRFEGENRLPAYAGSAWRGAFGTALKKTVCVVRDTDCQVCMLKESCAYPYIFETPPPQSSEKMRLYKTVPHPFVLNLNFGKEAGSPNYPLGLTLFGRSHRYLPYLIHAFEKAGKRGLGSQNQVFELFRVEQITTDRKTHTIYQGETLEQPHSPETLEIPECPDKIVIHLQTPLRIKQEGKNCNQQRLNFYAFFGSLLRRHSMLTYFHTDTPLETDFSLLMQQAKEVSISRPDLSWHDWTRYSSRQQTKMNMGGLMGNFAVTGDLKPFWPYLWLGQWTHVGKGTSMGLGAYKIEAASLPALPN